MLLENEVDKRIANNRQFLDPNRNRRLSVDEKPVIVWGWSRAWSASLYIQMDGHKFQCRICGEIRTTRTKVMRHILSHFLPDDIARTAALNVVERPL